MNLREDGKVLRTLEGAGEETRLFEVALGDAAIAFEAEVDDCTSAFRPTAFGHRFV